ncbi:MAG TPA: C40 family peptidase [Gaiellaceae bacterium]
MPMQVTVLRLLVLAVLAASALAFTSYALARPPVFAVVPSQAVAGASTQPQTSLTAAVSRQIAADRRSLGRVLRSEQQNAAAAHLAAARTSTAKANDLLASEDLAGRAQQAAAADAAHAVRLRQSIAALEKALQPVVVPAAALASAPNALGAYAVAIAERYLGVRYVWGGGLPESGFDCSGFVKYVYGQLGVQLPHYAASQWDETTHVDPSQLEPGDLVFFEPKSDGPGHVGMYVGNGTFIEAPHTGAVVQFQNLAFEAATMGFVGAGRPSA